MPAKSKSQQMAAGAALAAKRGKKKVADLKGSSKSMYKSMSEGGFMTWRQPSRRANPIMYRSRNVGEAVPSRKRRILSVQLL